MVSIQYRPSGRSVKAIADDIEAAVRTGRLLPGTALPTVRALAGDLEVAPGTVAGAYASLRDRGLTESRGRHGTFVRGRPPVGRRSVRVPVGPDVVDLAYGQPSARLLPPLTAAMFTDLRGPAAAPADGLLPEFAGEARRRLSADGVPADQLAACLGGLDGIQRVLTAQLRPGDAVAVEDPGWPNALDLVAALGLRALPLAVDQHGPHPDSLRQALQAGARAVIITSRAHNPTGAHLDRGRRTALRSVLRPDRDAHSEVLVIEDDHAAELSSVELCTLAGATDRWAFVRSLSKPYGPDLRIGVLAGDAETIGRVTGRMQAGSGWVSTLSQRLALAMWTNERVGEQVVAAGRTYDTRRISLLDRLSEHGVEAVGASGLNVWVPLSAQTAAEADAVARLLQAGWAVAPGVRFRQLSGPGLRITVSNLDERTIPRLAHDIAEAVDPARSPGLGA